MIETLDFTYEEGDTRFEDVTVFALSTCGFCRMALNFLRDNSIKFRYVYIDELEPGVKQELKDYLKKKYKKRLSFPFLVIDQSEVIVGFIDQEWEETFRKK